ncbi:FAD-dependent oxidoreductase [Acidisoma sp. S159]|uniref:FAD-dependent oxidoreductase n=1 Tax=Acidisoma sp. S159 TaxID=1747225 RepID=UPI00131E7316|nr:FAD-dependent oxidoreductase [Acidisoma sp. S159]
MRILIVGGSDAGISAALRIRELDRATEVSVLLADDFPNWSICGLPYYLSGETPRWQSLAHRTEFDGIDVLRSHRVESIDPTLHRVTAATKDRRIELSYDRLILGTGAVPVRPDLPGINLPGVYVLHTMNDALTVNDALETRPEARTAVIIGAGYIGLEMAEALAHRGLKVTVISRSNPVFPTVDAAFGRAMEEELERHDVRILVGCSVTAVERLQGSLRVCHGIGLGEAADLVIVATGTRPDTRLARDAGLALGQNGAITVDRAMRTSASDVFAAGDCVQTWHRMLERDAWLPLGTTSHKQGRIAGETALGGNRLFEGSVGTQVVKLFDLVMARTGLLDREALAAGFDPLTVESQAWDHKAYYPGARELRVRITGDRQTGRLLGAQIIGPWKAEVAKRIDIYATALFHTMSVDGVNDIDLSYAPPFSSPWDPVQIAAQAWSARQTLGTPS